MKPQNSGSNAVTPKYIHSIDKKMCYLINILRLCSTFTYTGTKQ